VTTTVEFEQHPMHERAYALAAAGLLHDVGKLLEPAGVELSEQTRNLEQMYCPTDRVTGRHTHRHVLYTAHAFEQIRSRTNFGGLDVHLIHDAAMHHHKPSPDRINEHILTRADWTASGNDRAYVPQGEEQQVNGMMSILSRVQWPGPSAANETSNEWLPTESLDLSDSILPAGRTDRDTYRNACASIVPRLLDELCIEARNPRTWMQTAMSALERHLHTIPASRYRRHQPDVSLYDHSRSVAAFAACLAVLYPAGNVTAQEMQGGYRVISISGGAIQSFLFRHIPPLDAGIGATGEKGQAKQLRARSFLVGLVTRLAAERLLDAVGLPPVCLLLDAGGRSLVLLPDDDDVLQCANKAMASIDRWMDQQFAGTLRLDMAISRRLTDDDFLLQNFGSTYRELDDQLAASRFRLPFDWLRDNGQWSDDGWVMKSNTGERDHRVSIPVDRDPFLRSVREFGQHLPKVSLLSVDSVDFGPDKGVASVEVFGYRVSLHNTVPDTGRVCAIADYGSHTDLPWLMTAARVPVIAGDTHAALNRLPGSVYSESQDRAIGQLLTFEELAYLSTDDSGSSVKQPMLAALKADVDRLGQILGYGFGSDVSLGRYACLARQLDVFFKGFLTDRLHRQFPHIYTVFSGGDDLFLIGPWYDVIRFTRQLHEWFGRLSCGNTNLTFSAGIAFSAASTPVSHLAEHSEDALAQAKQRGRDRVTLGPVTVTWDEFSEAWCLHRNMLAATSAHGLNSSLAYRLLQYARMGLGLRETGREGATNPMNLKWRSQLNYDLKRNLPVNSTDRKSPELDNVRRKLMETLTADDLRRLHIAATLTLYYLRGEEHEQRA